MSRLIVFLLLGLSACAHEADVAGSRSHLGHPSSDLTASIWQSALPSSYEILAASRTLPDIDPELSRLIDLSKQRSTTLAEAKARIAEARARLAYADANASLDGTLSGSARTQRQSENGTLPIRRIGLDRDQELYQTGFDASWELDFFGNVDAGKKAAKARLSASKADLFAIRLSVVTEVIRTWNEFQGARIELEQQRGLVRALEESLGHVRRRASAGDLASKDVAEWTQRVDSARAVLPGLEARIEAARLALATLSGQPSEDLLSLMERPAAILEVRPIAKFTRAEVIGQRPDIIASERRLRAAIADVDVAKAQLYPRISLSLSGGWQATQVSELSSASSIFGSIGPSITWRIFERGRVRADIGASSARQRSAMLTWEQTVISAINDVERARSDLASAYSVVQAREAAFTAALQADVHAARRLAAGDISRIERLDIERQRCEASLALARARLQVAQAGLALNKALGQS